jgi:hypothetical protein
MIIGALFAFWRFWEIITLIPTLGMLAYFVHIYASNNALTPNYILILFIVSVLGAAWAICTLFTWHRSRENGLFVAFIDLCFVGAFIGAVYELRGITNENCTHISSGSTYQISGALGSLSINGLHFSANKQCAMLKASFAFGIMNCVFFFITSMLAFFAGRGSARDQRTTYVKETHVSRHGHRRSGSHRSHRSSHSRQRSAYV